MPQNLSNHLVMLIENNDVIELLIAWTSGILYVNLSKRRKVSLLPVSSIHMHSKIEDRPGYYSDVIIHKSLTYY